MEGGSRTRMLTAMILVVVLGAGVMLGLVSVCNVGDGSAHCVIKINSDSAVIPVEEAAVNDAHRNTGTERRRTRIYEKVEPTEAQLLLIDSILEGHKKHMRLLHEEFWASYDPRYQAVIQQTREAILKVFTEEQASEYRSLLQDFDESRSRGSDKRKTRD